MFVLLAGGIFIGSKLVIFAQKIFEGQKFSFARLFTSSDKLLQGEDGGEIKILLMGISGGNHDGATLADTMILATLKLPKEKNESTQVSLFSIPRDLAANVPGFGVKKINSAYAYGEAAGKNNGPMLAVDATEDLLGTDIPYYAVIDFQGFEDIINHLGGIKLNVETGFTDELFPDDRGGYLEPLVFHAGEQTMDGRRALQYVRSRHGNNNQGSDFARARRQQVLLKALKDEVFQLKVLTNLNLLNQLMEDFAGHVRTNLEPRGLMRLYDLTKDIKQENILSLSFQLGSTLLCDYISELDGQFLLIPCAGLGNFEQIREFWRNQFVDGRLAEENPRIEIQNAAQGEPLAAYTAELLSMPHITPLTGNFSGDAVYRESVIYDNTGGKKPHTLSYLQEVLKIKTASSPFPFKNLTEGGADFVIVVTPDIKRP
ncbi:MAG: hypothetical protein A3C85_01825 [Candidatus Doudnabacteria bacterium RIFCSPHIGHO2_02_FULL_48_21]|uniref:Cell envelope-related transcriptional attenuator domain-containing protein n=1 Tax=Candidatus Doudnabacteria bacterium RIFCSPLOWO2_02_FULL_48_13 TaxID=1817845 RepID=A0A1F5QCZ3_9BACT|nr:MAG: hypothetical protein A3F44_04110 [Candidatus Doudnabacteria bacterium RIFCSPHIGHO2_12_FULL_47_25]OGE93167.1 MAG: hypothetical protein A3C85_01825 [Candidatus Doudnabacteria bacterium RIFCSPHIGHO2_02_FULL_48_21]OGF00050.1 MAG: hypothetical protein A3J05_03060 [Candidatus Doudnabacteria bacterium RIFCSPLOWO2_02_FULL_48_13]